MTGEHSYLFRKHNPHEAEELFTVPAKTFHSSAGLGEMAKNGTNIQDFKLFNRYVMGAIDIYRETSRATVQYEQYGWKDEDRSFLYGDQLYTPNGRVQTLGTKNLEIRTKKKGIGPHARASLAVWQNAANRLFAEGLEVQSLCLLASFAAPLMKFQDPTEGGAIIHLTSEQSAKGKTTALIAAGSVWGNFDAMRMKTDDSRISKSALLTTMGNLPVIFDEWEGRDPDIVRDFIISFTNGADRSRATKEGYIKNSEARWQTLMVSAGNTSLKEILTKASGEDTRSFRVIEFEATLPDHLKRAGSDEVKNTLNEHAGVAGDVYLDYVVRNRENVVKLTRAATEKLRREISMDNEYRFWWRTFGAITAAALVTRKIGLLEFNPDRLYAWIKDYVSTELTGGPVEVTPQEHLARFVNDHINHMLPVQGPFVPGRVQNMDFKPMGSLYIRREEKSQRIYISIAALSEWCVKNGIRMKSLLDRLQKAGILRNRNRFITLGAGTPLASGQTRVIEIDIGHQDMSGALGNADEYSKVVPLRRNS